MLKISHRIGSSAGRRSQTLGSTVLHMLSARLHGRCSVILYWKLEISHGGSIYALLPPKSANMAIHGLFFFFLSQFFNFYQQTTASSKLNILSNHVLCVLEPSVSVHFQRKAENPKSILNWNFSILYQDSFQLWVKTSTALLENGLRIFVQSSN